MCIHVHTYVAHARAAGGSRLSDGPEEVTNTNNNNNYNQYNDSNSVHSNNNNDSNSHNNNTT